MQNNQLSRSNKYGNGKWGHGVLEVRHGVEQGIGERYVVTAGIYISSGGLLAKKIGTSLTGAPWSDGSACNGSVVSPLHE